MSISKELIDKAKSLYNGRLFEKAIEHYNIENYNEKNHSVSCPFHEDKTPSMVLNSELNNLHCFSCNKSVDILDILTEEEGSFSKAIKKLFEEVKIDYNFNYLGIQNEISYKYPKRECNKDRSLVEQYLKKRKISKETLDFADVQQDEKGNMVFHYYDDNDVLTTVAYRPARKLNNNDSKLWFQKEVDNKPILYNMNRCDPSKPLLITEGQIDTLSIIESGYHNVVSVPNGSQNMRWIEECWNWLEQFDKIIIFGDNDEPGIKMRNEVIRRLGSWRCSFIEITDPRPNTNVLCKDANEILYFYGKDKILEYIKHPTETPVEGVLDLFSVEDVDYDTMPGLYTHIKQFDDKIVKLFYSQLVILTGKSGEGKSSFLSSVIMAQALEQNESLYIYSGELSPSNVKNWLSTSLLGRENIKMKNNVVRIFNKDKYAKLKEWSKEKVFIHDNKKGIDEDSILNSMEETTRKKGCKIFCIDNLMSLNLKDTAGDDLKAQTAFINRLKNFADKYQVLVILVSHPRKGAAGITHIGKDDIAGSSNIVNLADIVISVKRYSDKEKEGETNNRGDYIKGYEPVPYDVCIEVIKNRINGQMPKIDMYYDPVSMRFYNDLEGLWYRFKFDDNTTPIPDYDPNPHGEKEGDSPL